MQVQDIAADVGQASPRPDAGGVHGQVIPLRPGAGGGQAGAAGDGSAVRLYRVAEAMTLLGLSRSEIYRQFKAGRLRSVHQGRARLIPAPAIAEYVALLESEAER